MFKNNQFFKRFLCATQNSSRMIMIIAFIVYTVHALNEKDSDIESIVVAMFLGAVSFMFAQEIWRDFKKSIDS